MRERGGALRLMFAAVLMLGAWALGGIAVLVPLHEYAWMEEPEMRARVRPETALALLAFSLGGLALAAGALAVAFPLKGGRRGPRLLVMGAAGLALLVCGARLAQVLPAYSG